MNAKKINKNSSCAQSITTQKNPSHAGERLTKEDSSERTQKTDQHDPADSYKLKLDLKLYKPSWMKSS